jgi:hypothetical protein
MDTPSLTPEAVAILWPVLQIAGVVVAALTMIIGGLWVGFRWLRSQMREVGMALISPVAERLAVVEKSAEAAHRRIDEWLGARK